MQSATHLTVRCSVHPPQLLFYKKGGRLSAHFHPYLCGRFAAEWLIFMKIKQLIQAPDNLLAIFVDDEGKQTNHKVVALALEEDDIGSDIIPVIVDEQAGIVPVYASREYGNFVTLDFV